VGRSWTGNWAEKNVGIVVRADDTPAAVPIEDLVGVALRRNPKRVHLLVSSVLGKHVPADPRVIEAAGVRLGGVVREALAGQSALVVGFAETATLLGQLVADELDEPYIHSTRRRCEGRASWASFSEAHSHATSHRLLPWPTTLMDHGDVVVLVDDEVSTARTVLSAIEALHGLVPRKRYIVASLVDMSDVVDRRCVTEAARSLGAEISRLSLAKASVEVPDGIVPPPNLVVESRSHAGRGQVVRTRAPWPADVRESGRHGAETDRVALSSAVAATADTVGAAIPKPTGRTHVLGAEELMYVPLRIALELGGDVTFSTTTRSPAVVMDVPGYPLRHGISFPAHELGASGTRYAYNIEPGRHDQIVLIVDDDCALPSLGGLLDELVELAPFVLVVTIPTYRPPGPLRGPAFGSYAPSDVGWLLSDLSDVALEAPTAERERSMQDGGHYAESLPIEYEPDSAYMNLFETAVARSEERVALAVATVGEQILRRRGESAVLVSLARAGTPIGVLLRRWAHMVHGLDWHHYSISIVRDRGVDVLALSYIAAHHDPRDVMFIDGWTGKGAIARELTGAIQTANKSLGTAFDATLAVLADPGHCVELFGTRDDFLIPSACLNSTVSGLVSRTVLNPELIRHDQFHGAKFYSELARKDVSGLLVARIAGHFAGVQEDALTEAARVGDAPDWRGWRAVESIAVEFRLTDVNLVKPGVGETTRVLLRRLPWKVLVRPDRADELGHIFHLAAERGVELVTRPDLAFSCVGLIRPAGRGEQ
jgi:orotate phosphoribosyltransferase